MYYDILLENISCLRSEKGRPAHCCHHCILGTFDGKALNAKCRRDEGKSKKGNVRGRKEEGGVWEVNGQEVMNGERKERSEENVKLVSRRDSGIGSSNCRPNPAHYLICK